MTTWLMVVFAWSVTCGAQESEPEPVDDQNFSYSYIEFDHFGSFSGNFEQGAPIETLEGGFAMILGGADETQNVRVEGTTALFTWPEESTGRPSRILMEGNVLIDHPKATISAGKADWNVETGLIVFTMNPVINMGDLVQDLTVGRCELNLETGQIATWDGTGGRIHLGKTAGGEVDPSLLKAEDILDWPAFIRSVKAQAKEDKPSPGKRIFSLVSEGAQNGLEKIATDILVQEANQKDILPEINKVIRNPAMYSVEAWAGIKLSDEVKELLRMDPATRISTSTTRMNRLLFSAAYPDTVAFPPEKK